MISNFTVLFDAGCPLCRAARAWLGNRAHLVPLEFVPATSPEARARFPELDHAATLRDLTVIADTGEIYVGDGAWLACLWALADYRGIADRLGSPALLPMARSLISAAAAVRNQTSDPEGRARLVTDGGGAGGDVVREEIGLADYRDGCDERCR